MKKFGEQVEGYSIPVLNEREIRASAGVLFLFIFIAIMRVIFKEDFMMMKIFVIVFFVDFIIRVFISPKFSPSLILGRLIVSKQVPEYVGAPQKEFAWKIGLVLATLMFILLIVINSYSVITGIICLICQVFLFFESVFGICLGCLFYPLFYKEKLQLCPGDICEVKTKHDIQKVSFVQVSIMLGFVLFMVVAVYLFQNYLSPNPADLWEILRGLKK